MMFYEIKFNVFFQISDGTMYLPHIVLPQNCAVTLEKILLHTEFVTIILLMIFTSYHITQHKCFSRKEKQDAFH